MIVQVWHWRSHWIVRLRQPRKITAHSCVGLAFDELLTHLTWRINLCDELGDGRRKQNIATHACDLRNGLRESTSLRTVQNVYVESSPSLASGRSPSTRQHFRVARPSRLPRWSHTFQHEWGAMTFQHGHQMEFAHLARSTPQLKRHRAELSPGTGSIASDQNFHH